MNADTFAAGWLEQWASNGGSVAIDKGTAIFAFRPENHEAARPLFHLIDSIPGAIEAVEAHMLAHGMIYYYNVQKERVHAC